MTPLYKKLGIKPNQKLYVINYPDNYLELFEIFPPNIQLLKRKPTKKVEFVHVFVNSYNELEKFYVQSKGAITKNGMIWISWPKGIKSTNINRDIIREYGLDNGLVDVKVASIHDYWSGLKFVYRLSDR